MSPFIIEFFGYRLFNQVIPYIIKSYLSFISEFLVFLGMYWNSSFIYECVLYVKYLYKSMFRHLFYFWIKVWSYICYVFNKLLFRLLPAICSFYKVYLLSVDNKNKIDKAASNKFIKISFWLLQLIFFNNFFQNRFFINTFEMGLNVIGLYFFNWEDNLSTTSISWLAWFLDF